jgi:hypothetical protein
MDCIFIDDGHCSAAAVEIDPDTGCATYSPSDNVDADWDEDDLEEWDDDSDDDDLWLDDDDEL